MAKLMVRRSRLSREYAKVLNKARIAYFFFVAFFLLFFVLSSRGFAVWQLILLLASAVCFSVAGSTRKDIGIYRQGLLGEKQVLRLLRKLDKDCLVAPNALIGKGKRYEVDALVLAPGSVTVIEVKHYKGTLEQEKDQWVVVKNGRYRKYIDNQIELLESRVRSARQLLHKNGLAGCAVQGILVFAEDTLVEDATYARLQREHVPVCFLSRKEGKRLLEKAGRRGDKHVPVDRLYEALVGK